MNNENSSQVGNSDKQKNKQQKGKENDENAIIPIESFDLNLFESFGMANNIISKNIEFLRNNKIIYICGCNLVIYDLTTRKSQFILRRYPDFTITSLSVAYRSETEGYVCIGEYNTLNTKSQISVINLFNHSIQYNLYNKDQKSIEWRVFNAKIMKNNHYCIALAKKEVSSLNGNINVNLSSNIPNINLNSSLNLQNLQMNYLNNSTQNLGNLASFNTNSSTVFSSQNYLNMNSMKISSINPSQTKFSFWKYSQELFISETILDEDIYDCAYNPKNSHELILCGKGYMRLWNVFINQGSLKEHPQRYLKNKQEKEHTFIKAEFFENKSFMFAVGTLENVIFIIEGFNVLCEINASYKRENIMDLNVTGIKNLTEEEDEILEGGNVSVNARKSQGWAKQGLNNNLDEKNKNNVTGSISFSTAKRNSSLMEENAGLSNNNFNLNNNSVKDLKENNSNSMLNLNNNKEKENLTNLQTENSEINNKINSKHQRNNSKEKNPNVKNSTAFENRGGAKSIFESMYSKQGFIKENSLQSFNLIGNNYVLFTFQDDSITYVYKLDKDLKRKKESQESNGNMGNSIANYQSISLEEISKENKEKEEIMVNRISKNIKQIINVSANEDHTKLLYMVEVFTKENSNFHLTKNSRPENNTNYQGETQICLYLFNRKNMKLTFEKEIFNNFFHNYQTTGFTLCEKNQMFYSINDNRCLRCFDYKNNFFLMQNKLKEQPIFITACPNNNLIGISFINKFSLYFQLREKLLLFSEFDVTNSQAKFSEKGDYIAIYGENNYSKMYNIYFIDTLYLNTVHIIENFKSKIKKLCWLDNDRYLFAMFENNNIFGWNVNMDFLTINLMYRFKDKDIDMESTYFRMIFKHFVKGNEYEDFEYDFKNDLIILSHKNLDKISVFGKNGKKLLCSIDKIKIPRTMKISQELRCIIFGMQNGSVKIFKWPFSEMNENFKLKQNLMFEINLHTAPVIDVYVTNSLKYLISASKDGSIYYSELLSEFYGSLRPYNLLGESDKIKPKIEVFLGLNEIFDYKTMEIRNADTTAGVLKKKKKILERHNKELIENKTNDHETEIKSLEDQKKESCIEEQKKADNLKQDLQDLRLNVENELEMRKEEHETEKANLLEKYNNKLTLYKTEIDRLQRELKELEELIESKFKTLGQNQSENFNNLFNNYWEIFNNLKNDIDKSLKALIITTAECEEAYDQTKNDYDKLIYKLNSEMTEDIENAKRIIIDKDQEFKKILVEEKTFKNLLDKKVMESDNVIKKNVQIKQNIIDTTQRTITLQEQLLETEKNLLKIDKKMDDLNSQNKHLEQIRFVLEHRMMALEKEKAPLENECYYLEKQKFNLQEEFNALILEINNKNQILENKQSQLKACLIQNFEVNDHIQYLKKKLMHLQKEIKSFILRFQDNEFKRVQLSIQENKATTVALHLRRFYDTYFETNIDLELLNFRHYSQKLQEETEKINISNNLDLILRDKGEEKLLSEKDKMVQIITQKEKSFKRMQDENTILISECNRLRKNLHEVYMHVVDIEKKFEDLTKINPMLNKTEIVNQIKNFIKQTHYKIKSKYDEVDAVMKSLGETQTIKDGNENDSINLYPNVYLRGNEYTDQSKMYQGEILKSVNDMQINMNNQNQEIDLINEQITKVVTPLASGRYDNSNVENEKNEYENFLILPEIKNNNSKVNISMSSEKSKIQLECLKLKQETGNDNIQCEKILLEKIKSNLKQNQDLNINSKTENENNFYDENKEKKNQRNQLTTKRLKEKIDLDKNESYNQENQTPNANLEEYIDKIEKFVDGEINHLNKFKLFFEGFKEKIFKTNKIKLEKGEILNKSQLNQNVLRNEVGNSNNNLNFDENNSLEKFERNQKIKNNQRNTKEIDENPVKSNKLSKFKDIKSKSNYVNIDEEYLDTDLSDLKEKLNFASNLLQEESSPVKPEKNSSVNGESLEMENKNNLDLNSIKALLTNKKNTNKIKFKQNNNINTLEDKNNKNVDDSKNDLISKLKSLGLSLNDENKDATNNLFKKFLSENLKNKKKSANENNLSSSEDMDHQIQDNNQKRIENNKKEISNMRKNEDFDIKNISENYSNKKNIVNQSKNISNLDNMDKSNNHKKDNVSSINDSSLAELAKNINLDSLRDLFNKSKINSNNKKEVENTKNEKEENEQNDIKKNNESEQIDFLKKSKNSTSNENKKDNKKNEFNISIGDIESQIEMLKNLSIKP